jgi:uncharacterized protein YceK
MRLLILLLAICTGLSGCATIQKDNSYAEEQQIKLILAKMQLQNNQTPAAKKTLSEIATQPPVAGVTDEALFRLALLNLETGQQQIVTDKSGKDLVTLLNKFKSSSWRPHATTLIGLIDTYDSTLQEKAELEKTLKNLKSSNASLTKENLDLKKENLDLKQDMEKLKKLDLELEMKKKR